MLTDIVSSTVEFYADPLQYDKNDITKLYFRKILLSIIISTNTFIFNNLSYNKKGWIKYHFIIYNEE